MATQQKPEENELIIDENTDGSATVHFEEPPAAAAEGEGAQTPPATGQHDEDEDEDDAAAAAATKGATPAADAGTGADQELDDAETDAEREAIRARRRQERVDKKQRQREREEANRRDAAQLRRDNDELRERLAIIERKTTGSELAQIDAGISQADNAAEHWKRVIAGANGDGAVIADATEKMVMSRRRAEDLKGVRSQFVANASQQQAHTGATASNPATFNAVREKALAWQRNNPWYDHNKRDVDSRVTATLDTALHEEGYDPSTQDYWDELDRRVTQYLPHRKNGATMRTSSSPEGKQPSGKQRTPVASSGREAPSSGGRQATYTLSPARVSALKEAGMWDDPKSRADMIKRYREADRAAAAEARSGNKR